MSRRVTKCHHVKIKDFGDLWSHMMMFGSLSWHSMIFHDKTMSVIAWQRFVVEGMLTSTSGFFTDMSWIFMISHQPIQRGIFWFQLLSLVLIRQKLQIIITVTKSPRHAAFGEFRPIIKRQCIIRGGGYTFFVDCNKAIFLICRL